MTRFQKRLSFTLSIPTYILATVFLSVYTDSPLPIISLPLIAIVAALWMFSDIIFREKR